MARCDYSIGIQELSRYSHETQKKDPKISIHKQTFQYRAKHVASVSMLNRKRSVLTPLRYKWKLNGFPGFT